MAKNETREQSIAARDLTDIATLLKIPAFKRYSDRQIREVQKLRETVLTDRDLDKDGLWTAREKFLAAYDFQKMMLQDAAACAAMLEDVAIGEDEEATPEI